MGVEGMSEGMTPEREAELRSIAVGDDYCHPGNIADTLEEIDRLRTEVQKVVKTPVDLREQGHIIKAGDIWTPRGEEVEKFPTHYAITNSVIVQWALKWNRWLVGVNYEEWWVPPVVGMNTISRSRNVSQEVDSFIVE